MFSVKIQSTLTTLKSGSDFGQLELTCPGYKSELKSGQKLCSVFQLLVFISKRVR